MKVYIITQGEYSDYHICGVFTDNKKAQKVVDHLNSLGADAEWYSTARIEEFDTDIWESSDDTVWEYYIDDKGKDYVYQNIFAQVRGKEDFYQIRKRNGKHAVWYTTYVMASDEEHARKIGRDLFYSYQAQKNGVV